MLCLYIFLTLIVRALLIRTKQLIYDVCLMLLCLHCPPFIPTPFNEIRPTFLMLINQIETIHCDLQDKGPGTRNQEEWAKIIKKRYVNFFFFSLRH